MNIKSINLNHFTKIAVFIVVVKIYFLALTKMKIKRVKEEYVFCQLKAVFFGRIALVKCIIFKSVVRLNVTNRF